jgi:4-amino-4-deoxy-L-arabinose transferase-like glycosyltransferase
MGPGVARCKATGATVVSMIHDPYRNGHASRVRGVVEEKVRHLMPSTTSPPRPWSLVAIVLLSAVLYLPGLRRDLPYTPEADEPLLVVPAISIAATGDLNPRWFGHPGSTVVYPLALAAHAWHCVTARGRCVAPDPSLREAYVDDPAVYVLLGRLLVATYGIAAVPATWLAGRRAFGHRVALLGAGMLALLPICIDYGQIVRTDIPALFFAALALWRSLVVLDRPSLRNQTLAGAAIGLAVSTRYFMLALVPVLLAVDAMVISRGRGRVHESTRRLVTILVGILVIPVTFAATTPYFLLDLPRVIANLAYESRGSQLGADGLGVLGNLAWYVRTAIPEAMTWPLALLAGVGATRVLWLRRRGPCLLLLFPIALLAGVCLSPLHWTRWLIQALPVLALLAAYAVLAASEALTARLRVHRGFRPIVTMGLVAIAAMPALWSTAWADVRAMRASTRVLAREWMLANIPPGSKVAIEWWTAPLVKADFLGFEAVRRDVPNDVGFVLDEHYRLPAGGTLDDYRRQGFDYLVVSGSWFGPVLADAAHYPAEASFYRDLESRADRVITFAGARARGGPLIRVYALRP